MISKLYAKLVTTRNARFVKNAKKATIDLMQQKFLAIIILSMRGRLNMMVVWVVINMTPYNTGKLVMIGYLMKGIGYQIGYHQKTTLAVAMNYIGSKYKLIPFIKENIHAVASNDLSGAIFCDLFAGTGIVGRAFKKAVHKIISNDLEYYSFVLNQNYIDNIQEIPNKEELINEVNSVALKKGFIYSHYSLGGSSRQYFSQTNAQKIDAMRLKIEELKLSQNIDNCAYYFLLASLLESADKVANTASVYGAFLKRLKKSAQKELILKGADFDLSSNANEVYQQDASELIKKISGDILYLDPPYNARQYGANYHLLNTIAAYTPFAPKGKTGLPSYQKSSFCSRAKILNAFENLIKTARFKYIFLSYNNEGLMGETEIGNILKKYGAYSLITKTYMRFKADNKRAHKAAHTKECLHILIK